MAPKQGDPALLNDPVAQELLHSTFPARLAYVAPDSTPRVVPIWFHWDGTHIVMGTPPKAPKVRALREKPDVVLSIDSHTYPYKIVQIRGKAALETLDGVVPEYAAAAQRYFGEAQGRAWMEQVRTLFPQMVRISVRPDWVGILDFETRVPSAIANAMAGAPGRG